MPIVARETFAPILYVMKYKELEEAIAIQNSVEQGLSSAVFTSDLREAEHFLSPQGSDCGISNVNIGTSGGDRWGLRWREGHWWGTRSRIRCLEGLHAAANLHHQLRRELPLAQGVRFDVAGP